MSSLSFLTTRLGLRMDRKNNRLNNYMHYHVLVPDGVFRAGSDGEAMFHPALELDASEIVDVQTKMRARGLSIRRTMPVVGRWMSRCSSRNGSEPDSRGWCGRAVVAGGAGEDGLTGACHTN